MIFFSGYDEEASTSYRMDNASNIGRILTIRTNICRIYTNDMRIYSKEFAKLVTAIYRSKDKSLMFSENYTSYEVGDLELWLGIKEDILKYLHNYGYNIVSVEDLIAHLTSDIQKMNKELLNRCNPSPTVSSDTIPLLIYNWHGSWNSRILTLDEILANIAKGYTHIHKHNPVLPNYRYIITKCDVVSCAVEIVQTFKAYSASPKHMPLSKFYSWVCTCPATTYMYRPAP